MNASLIEHLHDLATLDLALQVVAPSDVHAPDEYVWHRPLPADLSERILHLLTLCQFVQFDCLKVHIHTLEDLLGLVAVGTPSLREDQHFLGLRDEILHALF